MYPKPKPEDEAIKKLKQLGLQQANKRCFDCGQRGPTYINVTIGSFVCSSCGGLLRGIAPPQRIKSVSMASFSPAEIEMIEQRGNEVCASIWLGKWNKPDPPTFDKNSEIGRRDFLCDKYEKKLWYVDPSQAVPRVDSGDSTVKSLKQIAAKQSPSPISVARSRKSSVTSVKTPPTVKAPPPAPVTGMVRSASLPTHSIQRQQQLQPSPQLHNQAAAPQNAVVSQNSFPQFTQQQQQNPPPLPPKAAVAGLIRTDQAPSQQNFANFDAFGLPNNCASPTLVQSTSSYPVSTASILQPISSSHFPQTPASGVLLQPMSLNQPTTPIVPAKKPPQNDRYAALADLDSTLRSLSLTTDFKPPPPSHPPQKENHSAHSALQTSSNPFLQGGWGGDGGAQQQQGQGGVSMINTSSIMSTGKRQGTPSSQFGNFPATDFPAANSVGQPFYGQNQNQFNMQASHLNNTSQQQPQFVAQSNPFQQPLVSQPNQLVAQQPFVSQPNQLVAQQPFVSQPNQFTAQQQQVRPNAFVSQQQFVSQSNQFAGQQQHVSQQNQQFVAPQQKFATQPNLFAPQQQPQLVAQQPQLVAQQPQLVAQQPQLVAQQPQLVAQQPQLVAQQSQLVAQQPQLVAQQPHLVAQRPQLVAQQPFVPQSNQFNQQMPPQPQQIVNQRFMSQQQMLSAQVAPCPTNPFS